MPSGVKDDCRGPQVWYGSMCVRAARAPSQGLSHRALAQEISSRLVLSGPSFIKDEPSHFKLSLPPSVSRVPSFNPRGTTGPVLMNVLGLTSWDFPQERKRRVAEG